jgi:hypothetical protein
MRGALALLVTGAWSFLEIGKSGYPRYVFVPILTRLGTTGQFISAMNTFIHFFVLLIKKLKRESITIYDIVFIPNYIISEKPSQSKKLKSQ